MSEPNVAIGCVANLFSRMMHFAKVGDFEQGHRHSFDHLTLLAKGQLEVTVEKKVTVFVAPQMIYIRADKMHKLVALEDDTLAFCIHALKNLDNTEILDPSMIPNGVNPRMLSYPLAPQG